MTEQDVFNMAREVCGKWPSFMSNPNLQTFAKLVAAKERKEMAEHCVEITRMAVDKAVASAIEKEREACAEIAEKQRYAMNISLTSYPAQNGTAVGIANQIRARGEA